MTIEAPLRVKDSVYLCPKNIFAGYESPGGYYPNDVLKLRQLHEEVAIRYGILNPYYKYADTGEKHVFKCGIDPEQKIVIKAGPMGSFTQQEMAVFIQEQARNYVQKDTMGKGFPRGNLVHEEELLALFMDGFSGNDVILMAQSERSDMTEIIGGARITRGTSSDSLFETATSDGRKSSLSTFAAVKISKLDQEIQDLTTPESDVACIGRFWVQDKDTFESMRLTKDSRLWVHLIASMPFAYSMSFDRRMRSVPEFAIYDTHVKLILDITQQTFGASMLADNGNVVPTEEVMESILKYHYGTPEKTGGYGNNIYLGLFHTNTFLEKSEEYFRANKISYQVNL